MYYAQARYYTPHTGRFFAEDPIKDQMNWYMYCNNEVLISTDPSGLELTSNTLHDDGSAQGRMKVGVQAGIVQYHPNFIPTPSPLSYIARIPSAIVNSSSIQVDYGVGLGAEMKKMISFVPIKVGVLFNTHNTLSISTDGLERLGWTTNAYVKGTVYGYGVGLGWSAVPSSDYGHTNKLYLGIIAPAGGNLKPLDFTMQIGTGAYFGFGAGIGFSFNGSEFMRRFRGQAR